MAEIKVQKVLDPGKKSTLPVFKEIEQIVERIRARAFDLSSGRGFAEGHAIDDWLTAEREICWPATELTEDERTFSLSVALPGFEAAEISVTATANELIVHATSKARKGGGKLYWSEFRSNDVYRLVDLPKVIDPQSVSASLHNGLLKIVATKSANEARVVPISSAAA
ncbi:MAG TPA: Hsp20 family protein [Steroidobacteraceae bacterium]|nr:Hsp20 family protein [Steroidobacteraceae bacterium]